MPSSDKVTLLLAVALAGCGGGRDAPAIALPPGAALASDAPRPDFPPSPERDIPPQRAEPLVAQDPPPEMPLGAGPRGTSGEVHEDGVGYAALLRTPPAEPWSGVSVGVAHPSLPVGTPVELTALDTGRTIVALVVAQDRSAVVALSPGAAQALGVGDHAAVRVRTVFASPQDQRALRAGQAASPRLDAPPALLTALRRQLPDRHGAPPSAAQTRVAPARPISPRPISPRPLSPQAPSLRPQPTPAAVRASGFVVQVAALSLPDRAAALARQLGGRVERVGKLYRVQLGPFATASEAQRARDGAARRGYGDARISHTD